MSDPTQSAPDGSSVQVQASDHSVAAHTVQGNVLAGTGNQVVTGHVVITHPGVLLPGPQDVELARPLVGLPRPPSRVFVGRDKLLAQLHASAAGATAVVTQTIAGLGGIGKTELVLHYCHTHRDQFSILWWITADRPDSVEAGLAGLTTAVAGTVNRTGPAKVGEAATWAQGLLTANPGWLLVFDNVEDQADVEGWLARLSGGRVLVTSRRDTDWENRAETLIRLDVLDTDAAVAVLTSGQNQPDLVTARELAAELGLLPLALTQAAAYMACTRIIVSDYLARLRARPAKTLATAAPGTSGVQQTVARVWDLTLAAIGTADPFAIDVLRVLSCLAPDNVPRRLLAGLGDEPETVDVALGLLASYSMITLTERAVSVHRLVQAVVIAQAAQVGVAGDSLWQALDLLDRACPMDDPRRTTQDWPWWAVLVPHMQAVADRWPTNTPD